ncbi:MAG: hypothetical protein M3O50_02320, partial [Myxococcota bacterium]|nr:hypothetical protein [Myxococcota bacterium]
HRHPPSAPTTARLALFGAVGVRAASDLPTAFTRAFPQAASADAMWLSAPFGSAGTADITLVIDEGGHLVASRVEGTPSPPLRRGIARTLALLGPRAFTAHAPITRLRVVARVTRDDVHDGLHGDVFAMSGGSFADEVGTAFFALPAAPVRDGPDSLAAGGRGRRVDISLRLASVLGRPSQELTPAP